MNFKQLSSANFFILSFYIIFFYLGRDLDFLSIPKIISGLALIFVCGLDLAVMIKIILKKDFDFTELLSLAFLGIIILIPFFLFVESAILKKTQPLQPLITLSAIILSTSFVFFLNKKNSREPLFEFPSTTARKILSSPLAWTLFLGLATILATVFLYEFLPDKDPFKWYVRLTQYFESTDLSNFSYRPLFYSVSFLFVNLSGMDTFIFLKYVIPILFASVFFPIWMVARKTNDRRKQFLILLAPFLVPNAILYSMMGIPQTFFMILLYYFVFFLLYSYLKGGRFCYYTAGIIALSCALYHEAGTIIIAIWIIATLAYDWRKIISNKKDFLFLLIIFVSNLSLIKSYAMFIMRWAKEITVSFLHPRFNYTFPLEYVTVDGIEAGSKTIIGVAKTYLGYAGPAIALSFLAVFYLLVRKKIEIKRYRIILKKSRELQILFAGFLIFFTIAEILPRFPGIAMLPDRAWIYASIFFPLFFLLFAVEVPERPMSKKIYYTYITCILLSVGGAIHGNYLKKDLITKGQIQSAEWIKRELPQNRIIVSDEKDQLLRYFSQSKIFDVDKGFFHNEENLDTATADFKREIFTGSGNSGARDTRLKAYMEAISRDTNYYAYSYSTLKDIQSKNDMLQRIASNNIRLSQNFLNDLDSMPTTEESSLQIYIYYADPDAERSGRAPIFDKYPGKFEKVYSNFNNRIIIWKVL